MEDGKVNREKTTRDPASIVINAGYVAMLLCAMAIVLAIM